MPNDAREDPGSAVDQTEVRRALDAAFLAALKPVTAGLAGLYAFFAVVDAFLMPQPVAALQAALETVMAVGLLAVRLGLGRWHVPPQRAHMIGAVIAIAILVDVAIPLVLLEDPLQTTYMILLELGVGIFFLSWPFLVVVLLATNVAWAVAASVAEPSQSWVTFGLALVAATVLSALAHAVRLRDFTRLERLRLRDEVRNAQLEDAIQAVQRSEERFRRLSEATYEGVVIHDGQRILDANARFGALVGLAAGAPTGRRVLDFVAPESQEWVGHQLRNAPQQGYEATYRRADGTTFPAEVYERLLPFEGRTVRVAAVRDVTERKRADEASRVALERLMEIERLREIDRFKTQLLNMASHELNTPLTALKLQLHLLKSVKPDELAGRQRHMVDLVDRNVQRLSQLVHDMLDVARLESGRLALRKGPVNLAEAVQEAGQSLEPLAAAKNVTLSVEPPPPVWVDADAVRIGQVLYNLLSNAIKFTPAGGSVGVRMRKRGDDVVVEVRDTGLGLRPDDIPKLFQPFSQVHDPMQVTEPGSGLGLYISRGIVEQHGGRIWCESQGLGQGSTFLFVLPTSAPLAAP